MKYMLFLKKYKLEVLGAFVLGLVISVLEAFSVSLVYPLLQNEVNTTESSSKVIVFLMSMFEGLSQGDRVRNVGLFILGVTVLKSFAIYLKSLIAVKIRIDVSAHFQKLTFDKVLKIPINKFNVMKKGDIQTISTIHTNSMGVIAGRVIDNLHLPCIILALIAFTSDLSWKLTLVSLSSAGCLFLLARVINVKADRYARKISPSLKRLGSALLEFLNGKKTIHIFNAADFIRDLYVDRIRDYCGVIVKMEKVRCLVMPLGQLAAAGSVGIILYTASYFLEGKGGDKISIETLLVFLAAFSRLVNPINAIIQLRVSMTGDLPYFREVLAFITKEYENEEIINKLDMGKVKFEDSIEFSNIAFKYPSADKNAIDGLNLKIKKGAKIGIVGESGSGKSTFVDILLGLSRPDSGDISIDGHNIKNFSLNDWRRFFGVVSQDIFLFNDSINSNITFGKDIDQNKVIGAAKKAGADQFIQTMSDQYKTNIGDSGVLLSGGQRQRLAIARAIYKDPEIYVFDEATSALDTKTEKLIQDSIDNIGKVKTVIIVAHRLSTLENVDEILVFDKGAIVESGSHQELIDRKGFYFDLYQSQK